jgi:hypothetical protein
VEAFIAFWHRVEGEAHDRAVDTQFSRRVFHSPERDIGVN